MQYWNSEEIEFLKQRLELSTTAIFLEFCEEFGSTHRSYHSVQKKVKKIRDAYSEEPVETENEIEENYGISIFDIPLQKVDKEKKTQWKEEAQAWLEQLILDKEEHYFLDTGSLHSQKTSLCLNLSDLHFGKYTPEFNIKVARERLLSIPDHLVQSDLPKNLDEIVITLGGDLVEGEDIFSNQNSKIECPVLDQMKACVEAIWDTILKTQSIFNLPIRVEMVPGNHGRMSKTANEKSNWDNVVHYVLGTCAELYNKPALISVNVNFSKFKVFKIKDKTILLTHKGVKHTGTPAMREKIAGWDNRRDFDCCIHGHWHEWHIGSWLGKHVVANGCLCGPDDFSEEIAKEDDARQAYFFITPGKPIWGFSFIQW